MSTTKQRLIEELKRDLFSENDAIVLKALHKCREDGNASMVEPLLALNLTTSSKMVEAETEDMLNNLKVSGTEETFIKALMNQDWKSKRARILSFMWNSNIQPVEYMDVIANIVVQGDFHEALECVTLLDNIEDAIPEEQLLESLSVVREYLNENEPSDMRYAMVRDFERLLARHEAFDTE
jgi:hypothetical protein